MNDQQTVPASVLDKARAPTLARLILTAMLVQMVLVIIAMAATTYVIARGTLMEETLEHLESVASVQASRIEAAVARRKQTVLLVASRTQLRMSLAAYLDEGTDEHLHRVVRILADARKATRGLQAIHIADRDGVVLVSTLDGLVGSAMASRAPPPPGLAEVHVTQLFKAPDDGVRTLLSAPLELEGRRLAMLYIETTTEDIDSILSDYTGLSETGETVLAQRSADGGAEFIAPLRFDAAAALQRRLAPQQTDVPVLRALDGEDGITTDALTYRGRPALAAMRPLSAHDWGLAVIMEKADAFAPMNRLGAGIALAAALAALLSVLMARRTSSALIARLQGLVAKANRLAEGSTDLAPASVGKQRLAEFVELEEAYDSMTRRWIEQAKELQGAYKELARAQSDIVRYEKANYLGETLSTISHEVNTPLGAAVMGASVAAHELRRAKASIDDGTFKRDILSESFGRVAESIQIVEGNLKRANELMRSFRDIAVDQASERVRAVHLREYVADLLLTLQPKLMRTRLDVVNSVPPGIGLKTSAGALSRVLTNLVINASLHAFDEGAEGRLEISGRVDGDRIVMTVSDNGKGMSDEVRARAFDEYFTTRADSGGSGVGLHTSWRLATELLGGDLTVESEPGKGSTFTLTIARGSDEGTA